MKGIGDPLKKPDARFSYAEYQTWPDNERWELIDGIAWDMSLAPGRSHQTLVVEFSRRIGNFLVGNACRVYVAPFDVLLPDRPGQDDDAVSTVVQPDIAVICDRKKLTEKGCTGAPEWIIEILSPYTSKKDMNEKLRLYERIGVREYWIADPGNRYVHRYVMFTAGRYPKEPEVFMGDAVVPVSILPGLELDLSEVFRVLD